jgi:fatty acid desaturase
MIDTTARCREATRAYRARVLATLGGGGWSGLVEVTARAAQRLLRQRRDDLAPSYGRAALICIKAVCFTLAPLFLADRVWQRGARWAAPPLVLVAGMGAYGAVAVLHDLAHASFLPSKRLNRVLGYLVAPLLFLQYSSFRRSHLDHHRHSQSTADPKRFGVTYSRHANDPGYRTLDHSVSLLKGPVRLGAAVARLPLRLRQVMYLAVAPVFVGPAVLFFGGEFSVARRDWRHAESWLAAAQSAVVLGALDRYSPRLAVLFVVALLIGYSFVFFVFLAHLSPNQVYWTSPRRAELADALNVSDIGCGALLRWLGNGFADHHSIHHLAPAVPCYRLGHAAALVAPDLSAVRAPALDLLDPHACTLVYDNYFRSIVETNAEAWDYTDRGALRNVRPMAENTVTDSNSSTGRPGCRSSGYRHRRLLRGTWARRFRSRRR